jgi:pantetheine-phosphate adenylyltransferase
VADRGNRAGRNSGKRLRAEGNAKDLLNRVLPGGFPPRNLRRIGYVVFMRIAIYPGSFDPLTNGHLDVIERAVKLFDRVVVAVARNESKQPLFTLDERLELVRNSIAHLPNVEADSFHGLLVDYVESRSAQAIVRGLRAISDFEFEFQLALMNRKLNERVETIFMMPKDTYTFLSSRIIKEIARFGGDVSTFVPPHVQVALASRLKHSRA